MRTLATAQQDIRRQEKAISRERDVAFERRNAQNAVLKRIDAAIANLRDAVSNEDDGQLAMALQALERAIPATSTTGR